MAYGNESEWREVGMGIVHLHPLGYAYVDIDHRIHGGYKTLEKVQKAYRDYIRTLDSLGKEKTNDKN